MQNAKNVLDELLKAAPENTPENAILGILAAAICAATWESGEHIFLTEETADFLRLMVLSEADGLTKLNTSRNMRRGAMAIAQWLHSCDTMRRSRGPA